MRSMTEGLSCLYHVSPNSNETVTVKTRRYKQDAKGADFAQRVYLDVNEQAKTQARQCVLRSISAFRPFRAKTSPVKTRRRVADCTRTRKLRRRERTQKYVTETNAGKGARCTLIRVSLNKPTSLPSKRGDTSKTRRARILRCEFT